jgi:hypothetical protein
LERLPRERSEPFSANQVSCSYCPRARILGRRAKTYEVSDVPPAPRNSPCLCIPPGGARARRTRTVHGKHKEAVDDRRLLALAKHRGCGNFPRREMGRLCPSVHQHVARRVEAVIAPREPGHEPGYRGA